MGSSSDEQATPRARAGRARATRVRATREGAPRRTARRTTATKPAPVKRKVQAPKAEVITPDPIEQRKAPTPLASMRAGHKEKRRQQIIIAVVLLLGVGASAAVGYIDQGQIDVQQTIQARNERIINNQPTEQDLADLKEGETLQVPVPVQNTSQTRRLKGRPLNSSDVTTPAPSPVVASSTASSTDTTASSTAAIASSTEPVVDEVTEEEAARPSDAPPTDTIESEPTS